MQRFDRTDKSESPRCNYCGQSPASGFTEQKVIHRVQGGLAESLFTVCKDKPCGGYLQMSYEG